MKSFLYAVGLFFAIAPPWAAAGPQMDYGRLIDALRAAGVRAMPAGEVEQPFIPVRGRMIAINGEDVQVFQYAHAAAAAELAAQVASDGSAIGTSKPHWIDPPHFYRKGSLLVLYVGGSDPVIRALEAVLGKQFAGR